MAFLNKIFGDANQKYLKRLQPLVEKTNSLEPEFESFSDGKLKEKTGEFKERLVGGESLDDLLPEAFALVREAAKRTLNQRHFDVQLIGGMVLHQGKIAEMKTGEGKTLAATLPLYLNALTGKGCQLVTVNDYLAKRDAVWMGQIYHFLGLSVGCIAHDAAYIYDPAYRQGNSKSQILNSKFTPPPFDSSQKVSGRINFFNFDTRTKGGGARIPNHKSQIPNGERDKQRDLVGGFKVVESYLRPCSRKEAYLADIVYGTNNEFGFDHLRDNMAYDLKDRTQREPNFAIIDEVDSILIDEARTPLIISAPDIESSKMYEEFAGIMPKLEAETDYSIDEKLKAVTLTEAGIDKVEKILGVKDIYQEKGIRYLHHLEQGLKAEVLFKKDRDYVVKEGQVVIVDEFTGRMLPGRRFSGGLHQALEAKEGVRVQPESLTLASITFQNLFRMYPKLAGMTGTAATSAEEFDKVYGLDVTIVPTNEAMIRKDLPDLVFKNTEGRFKAVVQEIKKCHQAGQPVLVGTVSIEKNEYLGKLLAREGIPHQILNAKHHEREGEIIAQAGKKGAVTIATNMAGRGVDIILGGNPPDLQEAAEVKKSDGLKVIGTERHEARRIDNQLRGRSGRQGDSGSSQFFVSLEDDLLRIFGADRIKNLMGRLHIPDDQPIQAGLISGAIESAQAKIEGMNFDLRKHLLDYDDVLNKHREVFYKKRKEVLEKAQKSELKAQILEIIKKQGFSEQDYEKKEKEIGENRMREIEKFLSLRILDSLWTGHLENMDEVRDSVRLRAYGQRDPLVEYKNEGHRAFRELLANFESTLTNAVLRVSVAPQAPPALTQAVPGFRSSDAVGFKKAGLPVQTRPERVRVGRNDPCPCGSGKKYKKCCMPK